MQIPSITAAALLSNEQATKLATFVTTLAVPIAEVVVSVTLRGIVRAELRSPERKDVPAHVQHIEFDKESGTWHFVTLHQYIAMGKDGVKIIDTQAFSKQEAFDFFTNILGSTASKAPYLLLWEQNDHEVVEVGFDSAPPRKSKLRVLPDEEAPF